ncbi:MAG: MAPEG family protein [Pseudomonadota bacterium]
MSVELFSLTAITLLAASLWIPFIVGVNTAPAGSLPDDAPDGFIHAANWRLHRPWVGRAYRAHQNLLEQGIPFAILILVLDRLDGFTTVTAWTSAIFVALRLAHAVGYITGWAGFPVRPLIFTAGWVCCVILAVAAFTA